ncbi:MAG TPA: UDP-2,3-diacylglucosamine diphosphatase [Bacteroidales bacterium]|nr:UDP-2,3-diacylglucosamine diphosphatase [Bacteroidales bacterium]
MKEKGKIYFASDFHLGLAAGSLPIEREKRIVSWLDKSRADATAFYLLGDIFDFWWEYRKVVPKGFTRFLGKISEITDTGIPVHFFTGNHDMWVLDYFRNECGMIVHTGPVIEKFDGKTFYLAHGEGLGSNDKGYAFLLAIFRNKPLRKMYSALHPTIGMGIGHSWSLNSRLAKGIKRDFLGEDKEDLIRYAKMVLKNEKVDYFIFGHRHLGMIHDLGQARVILLGDWIKGGSFAVWDGERVELTSFD